MSEVMNMYNQNKKQKKGIIFSTAVIALGCLISALYANRTINQPRDYSVDLSQLDSVEQDAALGDVDMAADSQQDVLTGAGAGNEIARANGADVVNPTPYGQQIAEQEQAKGVIRENIALPSEQEDEKVAALGGSDALAQTGEQMSEQTQRLQPDASLSFSPEDGMGWPLNGDVILAYSMDKSIFFETLQQYRYNPAIYIGAEVGDNVNACARGQVVEIGDDAQIGKYLKMNLGSGYEVTYGQLSDLQVSEGDTVSRGQVIAKVAEVTKYYSVEGSHVYLKIEKDGQPVNPMELLQ